MKSYGLAWLYTCVVLLSSLSVPRTLTAQSANLIQDGDFESGTLSLWDICGGVRLADTAAGATALEVHQGRYALRLGSPTNQSCAGGNILASQLQAYYYNIAIPADANALTLSFWYSRVGNFMSDGVGTDLTILLTTDDEQAQIRILDYVATSESAGWNQARFELSPQDVQAARGRIMRLSFTVQYPISEAANLAYYIDQLQLLTSTVRTPIESAPPDTLVNDTSGAFVGTSIINNKLVTARSNLSGSDLRAVFTGNLDAGGKRPRWSKDGQLIGVLENQLQSEPGEQSSTNWAQITALTLMNADGSNQHELYRTIGKKLVPGIPPGCVPPRTDCIQEVPAIDSFILEFDWSPDGTTLALNICSNARYSNGHTNDSICTIQFLDVATGSLQATKITAATGVHWSRANRLLYRVGIEGPLLYGKAKGIYEADMSVNPPAERLVFAHISRIKTFEDVAPTWSPDGRYFVTLRFILGNHYKADASSDTNLAIMLFDRENPDNPRQLMVVDYGRSVGDPTWSPDGAYVAYSLESTPGEWATWWVELATGKTGVLTGKIVFTDWRSSGGIGNHRIFLPHVMN